MADDAHPQYPRDFTETLQLAAGIWQTGTFPFNHDSLRNRRPIDPLIHNPLSSKSICYSMITESTTPRNEVLPKSQTPPPQSVCVWLILSLSLIFTPTFPVWPRHPAGIFWDHFPWLISSQLISDDWRLTTPPAMHSLCGEPTPHARHLWEGSIQDPSAAADTKSQIPLCFQGIWLATILLAFVWKGLQGICYLDSVDISVKGGICWGICALSFGNHFKAVLFVTFFFPPFFPSFLLVVSLQGRKKKILKKKKRVWSRLWLYILEFSVKSGQIVVRTYDLK